MARKADKQGSDEVPAEERNQAEDEAFSQKNCQICKHPKRTAIEVLALNGSSFAANARRVSDEFDLHISGRSLKNHMLRHADDQRARQAGLLLAALGSDDDDVPLQTGKGVVSLLLADALQKVVSGEIRIDSAAQMERVLRLQAQLDRDEHQRAMDKERLSLQLTNRSDTDGVQGRDKVNVALGMIMKAIQDVVPEEYLAKVVLKAWSLGYGEEFESLAEVPFYKREPIEQVDMSQAVADYRDLGRGRTRQELEEMGHFDEPKSSGVTPKVPRSGPLSNDIPPDE